MHVLEARVCMYVSTYVRRNAGTKAHTNKLKKKTFDRKLKLNTVNIRMHIVVKHIGRNLYNISIDKLVPCMKKVYCFHKICVV